MPGQDDFLRFAAVHAHELVRLGHAATGELAAGERLAETALVEVFCSWRRPSVHRDPLLAARRAIAATCRRRSRFAATAFRGSLELRDFHAPREARGGLDDGELLWESLDHLSAPQRLIVALRYAANLADDEVARVLRRPSATVRRSQSQALSELVLAADLDVPAESEEGGEPGRSTDLEGSVRQSLRSHVDVPLDVAPLLRRVAERTASARQRPRRDLVLVGATGVLVVGAVAALLWSLLGSDAPHRRDALTRPPLPPGTQLVGYSGIAVVVPADWTLAELPCGRIASNGTDYRDWPASGQCTAAAGAHSVTFAEAPLNSPPLIAPPELTREVAGHVAMSTPLTRVDGVYRQTVFVFAVDFMMTARSRDRAVVEAITSSVRAVPAGFTVVPKCEQLPVHEAVAALSEAGLTPKLAFTSSLSSRYGEPQKVAFTSSLSVGQRGPQKVTFQNRASGSVVREGTAVGLAIPSP